MRTILSILFVSFFVAGNAANAAVSKEQLLSRVNEQIDAMYNDLSIIANSKSSSSSEIRAEEIRAEFLKKYFFHNEVKSPNEFKVLGVDNQRYGNDITSRRYLNAFYDMFRTDDYQDYSFKYERIYSEVLPQSEHTPGLTPSRFSAVIVKKVYYKGKKKVTEFKDTLIVEVENFKIVKWANSSSVLHIADMYNIDSMPLTLPQLLSNASLAYGVKNYSMAYSLYQSAIERFPNEGEPYYRMAIMLHEKHACEHMKQVDRDELALEYLRKAKRYGSGSIWKGADNAMYWIMGGRR